MKNKILISILILCLVSVGYWFLKEKPMPISLKQFSFSSLPGWDEADIKQSFKTFQVSCKAFLRQDPDKPVGSHHIHMKVNDWLPACKAAVLLSPVTEASARKFFKHWFTPLQFFNNKPVKGLFTGYYLPLLHGSMTQSSEYNVPIYGIPDNIVSVNLSDFRKDLSGKVIIGRFENKKLLPFYTRAEINNNVLKEKAPVLVWVNSQIDRLFLEIQGSGIVQLDTGKQIYLGYSGENGAPYTPVGKVMIEKGILTKENASMQAIRSYLEAHPDEILPITNQNKSFVFFRLLNHTAAMGAQGVKLSAGFSLAVDRKWIPLGTPIWLNTTRPSLKADKPAKPLQRLMIAQDTGGAIRGAVRGDVFWGAGENATYIAGKMKNEGFYWLLLPKHIVSSLPEQFNID